MSLCCGHMRDSAKIILCSVEAYLPDRREVGHVLCPTNRPPCKVESASLTTKSRNLFPHRPSLCPGELRVRKRVEWERETVFMRQARRVTDLLGTLFTDNFNFPQI